MPANPTPATGSSIGRFVSDTFEKFRDFLSDAEEAGIKHLGLTEMMNYASDRPRELGFNMEDHYGAGKTLRHLLLAGELEREHPALAGSLLNGHEYVTNVLQGQAPEVRERDLFNNKLGRELGRIAKSREQLEEMALKALPHARLVNHPDEAFASGFVGPPRPIPGTPAAQFDEGYNSP